MRVITDPETEIRNYNARAKEIADREKGRLEERAARLPIRVAELEAQWWAELRARFQKQAEQEFDRVHPPIDVPPILPLTYRPTTAKKAKSAA